MDTLPVLAPSLRDVESSRNSGGGAPLLATALFGSLRGRLPWPRLIPAPSDDDDDADADDDGCSTRFLDFRVFEFSIEPLPAEEEAEADAPEPAPPLPEPNSDALIAASRYSSSESHVRSICSEAMLLLYALLRPVMVVCGGTEGTWLINSSLSEIRLRRLCRPKHPILPTPNISKCITLSPSPW